VADEKQPSIPVIRGDDYRAGLSKVGMPRVDTGMSRIGSRCTRPADHT
jgi:hypothetical protein